jgi:transcriptional/translational regulatory protein YebC/TACO1
MNILSEIIATAKSSDIKSDIPVTRLTAENKNDIVAAFEERTGIKANPGLRKALFSAFTGFLSASYIKKAFEKEKPKEVDISGLI